MASIFSRRSVEQFDLIETFTLTRPAAVLPLLQFAHTRVLLAGMMDLVSNGVGVTRPLLRPEQSTALDICVSSFAWNARFQAFLISRRKAPRSHHRQPSERIPAGLWIWPANKYEGRLLQAVLLLRLSGFSAGAA